LIAAQHATNTAVTIGNGNRPTQTANNVNGWTPVAFDDIFITTNITEVKSCSDDEPEDISLEEYKDTSYGDISTGRGHGKPSPRNGLVNKKV
jgi:hypothetical protein